MGDLGVNWSEGYKRERRLTWEDVADEIHRTVTMHEAVRFYLPNADTRYHRIQCPIHNGVNKNFSYTEHGYRCFVCGASGDVIAFVKEVCELSTRADAMKRINLDFRLGLPIGGEISPAEEKVLQARREAAREKERKHQEWEDGYHALIDEYCRLDKQRLFCEVGSAEWQEAVKNIDRVAYEIDCYPKEPR